MEESDQKTIARENAPGPIAHDAHLTSSALIDLTSPIPTVIDLTSPTLDRPRIPADDAPGRTTGDQGVDPVTPLKTYSKMQRGIGAFARDAARLYKVRTVNLQNDVESTLSQTREVGRVFEATTGTRLQQRDILVVGAGQTAREVVAFSVANQVTAIDLDVIPMGWKPGPYLQLLKQNGAGRAVKTIGRKLLGIDRQHRKALCSALGVDRPTNATYLQMDASKMRFGNASFDLVYSFSVFEHLPDPEAVLREAIRVLRPGGMFSISLHLYSAEGGCHDLRIFAGEREGIPYWAQLRPAEKHKVIESCYMNEWRIEQWRELFGRVSPGCALSLDVHEEPLGSRLREELRSLRSAGELASYTDEELLSVNVRLTWQKPLH